ncbi:MAG: hypothetical protein KTR31_18580, partial [Myxococcales bacterium]|nr:hypothetical protein [Myxococcales bacterium]
LRGPSVVFVGWFGPRGLASILFVLLVVESGALATGPLLESVVVLTVTMSIVLHGASAYAGATRYGAYVAAQDMEAERMPVDEMAVRIRHRG